MWTPGLEKLVYGWGQKALALRHMHDMASGRANRLHHGLTIPAIILSAVASATAFTTSSGTDNPAILNTAFGCISLAVAALTSTQNFLRCAQKSEQHRAASVKFSSLYREIDAELTKPGNHRTNPFEFVQMIRLTLDHVSGDAPSIPTSVRKEFKKRVMEGTLSVSIDDSSPNRSVKIYRDREMQGIRIMSES
eukprot:jgi/Mesvir1/19805/Mv25383-RA.1